jgi:hypothetical protein
MLMRLRLPGETPRRILSSSSLLSKVTTVYYGFVIQNNKFVKKKRGTAGSCCNRSSAYDICRSYVLGLPDTFSCFLDWKELATVFLPKGCPFLNTNQTFVLKVSFVLATPGWQLCPLAQPIFVSRALGCRFFLTHSLKFKSLSFEKTCLCFNLFALSLSVSAAPICTAPLATPSVATTSSIIRRACACTTRTTGATASRTGPTAPSHTAQTISDRQSTTSGN